MISKKIGSILLILNTFGIFGFLFSFLFLMVSWFNYAFNLNFGLLFILSFILFYFIYFFSFFYLKVFIEFFHDMNVFFIKKNVLFLIFLYYFSAFLRIFFIEHYGVRVFLGFVTPLWLISLLALFNILDKKILCLSYILMLFELIVFYYIYSTQTNTEVRLFSVLISIAILLTFPFFLNLLKGFNFSLKLNKYFFIIPLSFFSVFGAIVIFYYYLFF